VLETYEKAGKKGWGVALRVPILYGEGKNEESAVNVLMDNVMGQKEGNVGKVDQWALRYPTNTEDVGRVLQGMFCFEGGKMRLVYWIGALGAEEKEAVGWETYYRLPLHNGVLVTNFLYRCRYQIPQNLRQIIPSHDPAILLRRQIHKVGDRPVVRRYHGTTTRQPCCK
jgi:hypothetical protein